METVYIEGRTYSNLEAMMSLLGYDDQEKYINDLVDRFGVKKPQVRLHSGQIYIEVDKAREIIAAAGKSTASMVTASIYRFDYIRVGSSWGWQKLSDVAQICDTSRSDVLIENREGEAHNQYWIAVVTKDCKTGSYTFRNIHIDVLARYAHIYPEAEIYLPAGFTLPIIREANGEAEAERQSEIRNTVARIISEIKSQGYSLYDFEHWRDDPHQIHEQVIQELADEGYENCQARLHRNGSTTSFRVIFYDHNRMEIGRAYFGNELAERKAELQAAGFTYLFAGEVQFDEAHYYIREK